MFLRELGVVLEMKVDSNGDSTWTTLEGQEDFHCILYFAGTDAVRSSLRLEGTEAERTLLLKHVKMRRLQLSTSGDDLRDKLNREISAALRDSGFRDGIVARADEATKND